MERDPNLWFFRIDMRRRLDDRIRELCAEVVLAQGTDQLEPILSELKSALHEHIERLRKMAGAKLVNMQDGCKPERRSAWPKI